MDLLTWSTLSHVIQELSNVLPKIPTLQDFPHLLMLPRNSYTHINATVTAVNMVQKSSISLKLLKHFSVTSNLLIHACDCFQQLQTPLSQVISSNNAIIFISSYSIKSLEGAGYVPNSHRQSRLNWIPASWLHNDHPQLATNQSVKPCSNWSDVNGLNQPVLIPVIWLYLISEGWLQRCCDIL